MPKDYKFTSESSENSIRKIRSSHLANTLFKAPIPNDLNNNKMVYENTTYGPRREEAEEESNMSCCSFLSKVSR